MEGGHGEVFMQPFAAHPLAPIAGLVSCRPEVALADLGGRLAIGNGMRFLTALAPDTAGHDTLPRASDAVLLPDAFTTLAPTPIYGRAPDAKPLAAA